MNSILLLEQSPSARDDYADEIHYGHQRHHAVTVRIISRVDTKIMDRNFFCPRELRNGLHLHKKYSCKKNSFIC